MKWCVLDSRSHSNMSGFWPPTDRVLSSSLTPCRLPQVLVVCSRTHQRKTIQHQFTVFLKLDQALLLRHNGRCWCQENENPQGKSIEWMEEGTREQNERKNEWKNRLCSVTTARARVCVCNKLISIHSFLYYSYLVSFLTNSPKHLW